jgi:hypothetical protein
VAGEQDVMTTRSYLGALWLLSGVPVGVVLSFLPPAARLGCFTFFVLLETGHNMAPIVLAWTHGEFRRGVALPNFAKFIYWPIAVLLIMLAVGAVTSFGWTSWYGEMYGLSDWTNLLPVAMWVYWPWKIYHFGMQHFGVMQILRVGGSRRVNMILCLAATAFGMAVVPALIGSQWAFLLMMGIFSVNHWVVDIGLAARVVKRGWLFAGAVLLMGAVGFLWMIPTSQGMMIRVIPLVICLRLFLGFTHFLYSRWVWKLSDLQVRATIGRDLLKQGDAAPWEQMAPTGAR